MKPQHNSTLQAHTTKVLPTNTASGEPRSWKIWNIGEFAKLTGVTIRTLRFYDRKGLLSPAKVSEAGYRLYSTSEMFRLQHILMLKMLGCSLETIHLVLERSSGVELARVLAEQRAMVEQERKRLDAVSKALAAAEVCLKRDGEVSFDFIHTILKALTMQPSKESQEWIGQFYSDEQKKSLANRTPAYMLDAEQGAKVAADWSSLIAEVNQILDTDPSSAKAQALADRWMALVGLFTQGDPAMLGSLNTMYANVENAANPAPADFQAFYGNMKPAMAFIQKAVAARKATA